MSEHTPGPWVTEEHLDHIISIETGEDQIYDRKDIAQVGFEPNDRLTAEANARLISAAPELLAAMEMLIEREPAIISAALMSGINLSHRFNFARAAVAKAKGEQP